MTYAICHVARWRLHSRPGRGRGVDLAPGRGSGETLIALKARARARQRLRSRPGARASRRLRVFSFSSFLPLFLFLVRVSWFMVPNTMCWAIWSVRNDVVLRNIQPSIPLCKTIFKREFAQGTLRAKRSLVPLLTQWLEGYV